MLPALARKTRAVACRASPKGSQGKRGRRKGAGGNALPPMRARIGRSRSCSRVFISLQKSTVGILAQRSEHPPSQPILEVFGDGRLAPCRSRESVAGRGRRDAVPDRCGNPHVTVFEIGPCRGNAGTLSMEGTSGHSSGLLFTEHLRMWPWHRWGFALAKASGFPSEATGVPEARWVRGCVTENVTREPGPARRSGSVRRETPGPPSLPFQGRKPWEGGEARASKRCWERERRGYS